MMNRTPARARAVIRGAGAWAGVNGLATFRQCRRGVLVTVEVHGLPVGEGECPEDFFGLHIHQGETCTGTPERPFAHAGGHFQLAECPHPAHTGDLPPLLGCQGHAFSSFLTDRFRVEQIIGRTLIVHARRDDFSTQPSGDAGAMIACGQIVAGC